MPLGLSEITADHHYAVVGTNCQWY